jgi:pimeloyl-ACP methyl ester carboxylesterase
VRRVLLLHGTALSPQVWDGVRAALTAPTIAPDLNAMIGSAGPGCLQTQLAAALLAALPADEMVVVGHSFGGQVAIELALLAPERLARLVIVCSRHTPFPAFAEGARVVRASRPVDIDGGLRRWFTAQELATDGPAVEYVRRQLRTAPRGPWAASLDAVATYDRTSAVGRIAAAALPQADLEVVAAWAHMSPFADSAAFATRLMAFV